MPRLPNAHWPSDWSAVQTSLPLAAKQWEQSIEHVHMLRVSSRRAQTALAIFGELAPKWRAAWMDEQMKRIRVASNSARDDDVFIRRLEKDEKNAGAAKLAKRVRAHRQKSQVAIVEVYDRLRKKNRLEKRIEKLVKRTRLRGKKNKAKKPTFSDWARVKFSIVVDDFLVAANCDDSDLEALHKMRITGKKVRYAMELLSGAFSDSFRKEASASLEKLQDKLGDINDHFNAIQRIEFWIEEAESARKMETRYLQDILAEEKKRLSQSHKDFCNWWSDKRESKTLENFREAMRDPAVSMPT